MTKKLIPPLLCLCLCLVSGCGYHISGTGKLFPPDIKNVAIPDFLNLSTSRQARQYISEAIRGEFIRKSGLRLAEDPTAADSLLEGEIISFQFREPKKQNFTMANTRQIRIIMSIRFIDLKTNTLIFEQKRLGFAEVYELESEDFFDNEQKRLEKIAKKLAKKIVMEILENF